MAPSLAYKYNVRVEGTDSRFGTETITAVKSFGRQGWHPVEWRLLGYAQCRTPLQGRLQTLPANDRLGWKGLTLTNLLGNGGIRFDLNYSVINEMKQNE